ncbi:MAG: hypothetical protein J5501_02835 [Ruminococcus sp.]|nr:hypothetical protein [Ruminococcus sp.]
MKIKKTIVCMLLAAVLAAQTSCEINGGIIGYIMDQNTETEEADDEDLYIPKITDESALVPAYQDADWWWATMNGPDFKVSNAQELISAAYYVNHLFTTSPSNVSITLTKDIDLAGYLWEPIGSGDKVFQGHIDGKGHTIKNMTIRDAGDDVGFIGKNAKVRSDATSDVRNITFTNVSISGGKNVGIVCGSSSFSVKWEKIKVYGEINVDNDAVVGMICGEDKALSFEKCSGKVFINGEKLESLSAEPYHYLATPHEADFKLESTNDGRIMRTGNYTSAEGLRWVVETQGRRIYEKECGDDFSLSTDCFEAEKNGSGIYQVFLEASFDGGKPEKCSNVLDIQMSLPDVPEQEEEPENDMGEHE